MTTWTCDRHLKLGQSCGIWRYLLVDWVRAELDCGSLAGVWELLVWGKHPLHMWLMSEYYLLSLSFSYRTPWSPLQTSCLNFPTHPDTSQFAARAWLRSFCRDPAPMCHDFHPESISILLISSCVMQFLSPDHPSLPESSKEFSAMLFGYKLNCTGTVNNVNMLLAFLFLSFIHWLQPTTHHVQGAQFQFLKIIIIILFLGETPNLGGKQLNHCDFTCLQRDKMI